MKIEYHTEAIPNEDSVLNYRLNELGAEGWQHIQFMLVDLKTIRAFFYRVAAVEAEDMEHIRSLGETMMGGIKREMAPQ